MRKPTNPMLLCDMYKLGHREQYPVGTEVVFSTWTPRTSRVKDVDKVVVFGFQGVIKKYLINYFNDNFFNESLVDILDDYVRIVKNTLGVENPSYDHIVALHRLGYLPIKICALPEGSLCDLRVPMLTLENTMPEFAWLTNYLETLLSNELWMAATSATTSFQYRKILTAAAIKTGGDLNFVPFQGHDFSMRGMSCIEAAKSSGSGHLLSFVGTDTIPAIVNLEQYYNANVEKELVGCSIPATEHSVVMTSAAVFAKRFTGEDALFQGEKASYEHLLTKVYPSGFVSLVSDTWNIWEVVENIIKPNKDLIMSRDGKVVIRPDSGDPVDIICGDPNSTDPFIKKGIVELLWDIFGGTETYLGYKVLDSHIGCIYGDAITLDRCFQICERLAEKGFASTNMVYGEGSYSLQYVSRDTYGFALKSTHVVVDGEEIFIYKDPITDIGSIKKSQTGRVVVLKDEIGNFHVKDRLTIEQAAAYSEANQLQEIFLDGKLLVDDTLANVRQRLLSNL